MEQTHTQHEARVENVLKREELSHRSGKHSEHEIVRASEGGFLLLYDCNVLFWWMLRLEQLQVDLLKLNTGAL